jgi:hypothetical protein
MRIQVIFTKQDLQNTWLRYQQTNKINGEWEMIRTVSEKAGCEALGKKMKIRSKKRCQNVEFRN